MNFDLPHPFVTYVFADDLLSLYQHSLHSNLPQFFPLISHFKAPV